MTPYDIRNNPIDARYDIDITKTAIDIIELQGRLIGGYSEFEKEYLRILIKFLRKYENGKFATIPHMIELLTYPWQQIKAIIRYIEQYHPYAIIIMPDESVEMANVMDGHIASTKIHLSRLADPLTYWTLSGNDWSETDSEDRPIPKINHPDDVRDTRWWLSIIPMRLYANIHGQWDIMKITRCDEKQLSQKQEKQIMDNYKKICSEVETIVKTLNQ